MEIVTTRVALANAIRQAIVECFNDPKLTGPAPRETIIFKIVDAVIGRVCGQPVLNITKAMRVAGSEVLQSFETHGTVSSEFLAEQVYIAMASVAVGEILDPRRDVGLGSRCAAIESR